MRRARGSLAAGLVASLVALACGTKEFDRHFEAGRYREAAEAFEADSSLHDRERALFRAAVAHALQGSQAHDPTKARDLLDRLLTSHPEGSYRAQATWILALLDYGEEWRTSAHRLRSELEQLKEIDLRPPSADTADSPSAREFDRHFEAGRYSEAARTFEADSSLHGKEWALFRAAVARALPGSPAHDPARARALLNRLLASYPETPYRTQATWILALLDYGAQWRRSARRLHSELERLKAIDLQRPPADTTGLPSPGEPRPEPRP